MLMMAPDGWPRCFLDPQMEEVIAGFDGAFSYANPVKGQEVSIKPKNDEHFINLLDAWGYGIVAVCPKDTPKPGEPRKIVGYEADGRTPILREEASEVGWHETRFP